MHRLPAGSLQLIPYKGKPVLSLVGRYDYRHKLPRKLTAGDVFVIGLSLIRVLYVGVHSDGTASSSRGATCIGRTSEGTLLAVSEDDGSKFQRAQAKSDKRSAKLAAQEAAEAKKFQPYRPNGKVPPSVCDHD